MSRLFLTALFLFLAESFALGEVTRLEIRKRELYAAG